jgi:hypothetical protein
LDIWFEKVSSGNPAYNKAFGEKLPDVASTLGKHLEPILRLLNLQLQQVVVEVVG